MIILISKPGCATQHSLTQKGNSLEQLLLSFWAMQPLVPPQAQFSYAQLLCLMAQEMLQVKQIFEFLSPSRVSNNIAKCLRPCKEIDYKRTLQLRDSHLQPSPTHQEKEGTALLVPSLHTSPVPPDKSEWFFHFQGAVLDNEAWIKTCLPEKQRRGWNTNRNRRKYSSFCCCISQAH